MGKYVRKSIDRDHEWSRNRTPLTDEQRDMAGANLGLAGKFANQMEAKYQGHLTRDELFSVACEGLVLAARGFKPEAGVKFSVYAFEVMRRRTVLESRNNHVIRVAVHSRYAADVRAVREGFIHMGDAALNVIGRPDHGHDAAILADLDASLARLDRRERDILLRRAAGDSVRRICRTYHISRERVRQIAVEAVGRLRKWMGGVGGEKEESSCA